VEENMSMAVVADVPKGKKKRKKITKEGWMLFWLCMPFCIFIFIFTYLTLFGWAYAFLDFRPALGANPFNHEFVGLRHFRAIFVDMDTLGRVIRNTLAMSGLGLLVMPAAPLLAILFMELKSNKLKRITQTVMTFPNFISWVIIYGITFTFFANRGVMDTFMQFLGAAPQRVPIMANIDRVWSFQTALGLWRGIGFGSIIYVAAIAGIDTSLYEAAKIDGASRIKCIRHITVPGISLTFLVLFLLAISGILSTDFERQFVYQNAMVNRRFVGIDLHIYRIGIEQMQFSFATAVGIIRSGIGLLLLFTANYVSKLIRGDSLV